METSTATTPSPTATQPLKPAKAWLDELKRYQKKFETYQTSGQSVVDRFRGESKADLGSKFNILRANVATLKPALYAQPPKPVVSRRFKDKNPTARMASTILERCLEYEITAYGDYDSALSNAVQDRLLPGRGVAWIRYEPETQEQGIEDQQLTDDIEAGEGESYENEDSNAIAGETEPLLEIISELTPCDYVFWKDFAHNANARTWEEVTWVARRVCVEKNAGVERFGDVFKLLPPAKHDDTDKQNEKTPSNYSNIWEIWHKPTKMVHWVCEGFEYELDQKPDPLGLRDFLPCPKPLYSTLTTDSLIPRPDYSLYQDQAQELDRVTAKIADLVDSLEIKGFYAKEAVELARLLMPNQNTKMIPVENWQALAEKGGIGGMVDFAPIEPQIKALAQLYAQRDQLVEMIYQLSGISDIQRGSADPNETATAQQIKAQFSSIRLGDMKQDVARFARDLLRMKAEVMAEKYTPETLIQMSGVQLLPEAQLTQQVIDDAIMLLKNERLRNFNIDIENDTLVEMDERAEQQARTEFLGALTPFLEKSMMIGAQMPQLVPVIKEMMLFGVRGFKVGQSMESVLETTFDQLDEEQKKAANDPKPPSPEEVTMQQQSFDQQNKQIEMQAKAQEVQIRAQSDQQRLQLDQSKAAQDVQIKQLDIQARNEMEIRKLDLERWKIERQEQTKLMIAKMNHENAIKVANMKPDEATSYDEEGNEKPSSGIESLVKSMAESNAELVNAVIQSNAMIAKAIGRPKRLVRDADGNKMAVSVDDGE